MNRTESAFDVQPFFDAEEEIVDRYDHDCGEDVCCCEEPEDNLVYCGACGDEGHTYFQCWSYDSMEGDR